MSDLVIISRDDTYIVGLKYRLSEEDTVSQREKKYYADKMQ